MRYLSIATLAVLVAAHGVLAQEDLTQGPVASVGTEQRGLSFNVKAGVNILQSIDVPNSQNRITPLLATGLEYRFAQAVGLFADIQATNRGVAGELVSSGKREVTSSWFIDIPFGMAFNWRLESSQRLAKHNTDRGLRRNTPRQATQG